jgi:uncharacterized protein YbjT (DUF2867 family)
VILVTGATGRVGGEVARRLLARGERPRAFARDPTRARKVLGDQVEVVVGDLDRPETVDAALAGVDRVFLGTAQSTRQPEWEGRLVDAAARAGVRHVVKLSVFRADERSPLRIARQHREAEHALERSGLGFTAVRPVFFMQNLAAMVRDGAIHTAAADGRVAMIDSRDVAAVAAAALERAPEGRTHTLTGPEALTFDDVARILTRETGMPVRHVPVLTGHVRSALQDRGVPPWFADDMATLQGMLAAGYEDLVTDEVRAVTGGPPRGLAQMLREVGL